jgi:hypothetical protein
VTAPSTPAPAPTPARRMGCFAKGCLTLLVLLLLLVGGGVALYRVWLGPKLQGAVSRWKEEHPGLMALAGLLEDRGPDSPLAQLQGGGRGSGGGAPRPSDLALLPDATVETFRAAGEQLTGYQRAPGTLASTRARLERGMARRGWAGEQAAAGTAGGTLLRFRREERSCQYELLERPTAVELYLRCDPAPAAAAPPVAAGPPVPPFLRRPRGK